MFRSLIPLRRDRKHRPTLSETTFQPCNIPPLLIVNAITDYHARSKDELSFRKGDLFHVINNSSLSHYQVCNPLTNQVGNAPIELFRAFDKKSRAVSASLIGGSSDITRPTQSLTPPFSDALEARLKHSTSASSLSKTTPLSSRNPLPKPPSSLPIAIRATALYTFASERDDELGFEQDEQLIIVARSTPEWLVAKKLDTEKHGLVPSTYIKLFDSKTGESSPGLESKLPSVKEWKQSLQEISYKKSNENIVSRVTSNTDSFHSAGLPSLGSHSPSSYTSSFLATPTTPIDSLALDNSQPLPFDTAHVTSFFKDSTGFVFVVQLRFESVGVQRNLYRDYTDFYNFHLALLQTFPCEAGRTGERRILPFMPGPLTDVDEKITSQRRADLDLYVQQLFILPPHIQQTDLFRKFFRLRQDDFETPIRVNHPSFQEQDSDFSFMSQSTTTTSTTNIHVKVLFQDEIFAFKLPSNASNFDLHEKVCTRFGNSFSELAYLDASGRKRSLDLTVPLSQISTTQSGKLKIFAV